MLSKRFVSLKGIFFFFPASIWRLSLSFCLPSGVAGCVLTHFSPVLPPQPYLLRGVQVHPPLSLYREDAVGGGRWVVVSSKLNLNCKFRSSPQKIVLLNILIACILTKLLLIQNRSDYSGWGCLFLFFFTKKVFLNVKSYRRSLDSFKFESSSPLQNGVPASLFFLPRLPSRA